MLNIKEPSRFGTIPTLRLEAMRGFKVAPAIFKTYKYQKRKICIEN